MNTHPHLVSSHLEKHLNGKRTLRVLTGVSEEGRKRFWKKVDVKGRNDCWTWNACRNDSGYGCITLNGKSIPSHRVSAFIHGIFTTIEKPFICHKCDNPPCCNPSHLFIGSQRDNTFDMLIKGRGNKACGDRNGLRLHVESRRNGEKNHRAKLNVSEAIKIIQRHKNGESKRGLAMKYNVSRATVRALISGKTWSAAIATWPEDLLL